MRETPMLRRVGVVAKRSSREALLTARELVEWLQRRGCEVVVEPATAASQPELAGLAHPLPESGCDLVVVLGGDGTLLSVARTLGGGAPILGVNLGRLGFLTEVTRHELYPSLAEVLAGRFRTEARTLAEVEVVRGDRPLQVYRALNDAVLAKRAEARIIELDLTVDGRAVTRYRADGLILSTPTGSTAYSLSAGGPILDPELPVTVISPICPHTLSLRPIVVPDRSEIEVALVTPREQVYLTVDGQEGGDLEHGDRVRFRRSGVSARLVRTTERGFFDTLRAKLHWGE